MTGHSGDTFSTGPGGLLWVILQGWGGDVRSFVRAWGGCAGQRPFRCEMPHASSSAISRSAAVLSVSPWFESPATLLYLMLKIMWAGKSLPYRHYLLKWRDNEVSCSHVFDEVISSRRLVDFLAVTDQLMKTLLWGMLRERERGYMVCRLQTKIYIGHLRYFFDYKQQWLKIRWRFKFTW